MRCARCFLPTFCAAFGRECCRGCVCVWSDNPIGDAGAKEFADTLKHNATLTALNFGGVLLVEQNGLTAVALHAHMTARDAITDTRINSDVMNELVNALQHNVAMTQLLVYPTNSSIRALCERNKRMQDRQRLWRREVVRVAREAMVVYRDENTILRWCLDPWIAFPMVLRDVGFRVDVTE